VANVILKSSLLKAVGLDLAPGYAALSELPRRRRRGTTWALWIAAGAVAAAGGVAVVLIR
jgi:hypothetical protein